MASEIVADLRDDLRVAFDKLQDKIQGDVAITNDSLLDMLADTALATIKNWCAKEPVNDND